MPKGTITVLKRLAHHDLIEQYQHETVAPCDIFRDGQVVQIETWDFPPDGFCEGAGMISRKNSSWPNTWAKSWSAAPMVLDQLCLRLSTLRFLSTLTVKSLHKKQEDQV